MRERYGLEVFRTFFARIVEQCLQAGLVWGEERSIDATNVEANAATDSRRPRVAVDAHLAPLFIMESSDGEDEADDGDVGGASRTAEPQPVPREHTDAAQVDLDEDAAARHDWIGPSGRPNRAATSDPDRRTADVRVSVTDLDATPKMRQQ